MRTLLLDKNGDLFEPKGYGPQYCLNVLNKIFHRIFYLRMLQGAHHLRAAGVREWRRWLWEEPVDSQICQAEFLQYKVGVLH